MTDIGILGGTFDPIHLGHTEPALRVAQFLSLDKILLIPTNIPPHKASPNISAAHRATMVELACEQHPCFSCDQRELTRRGHSYTIDTLQALAAEYPQQRLFFIIGLDSLLTFTTWHHYQKILRLCHLVVNTRPNYQLDSLNDETKALLAQHQCSDISALKNKPSGGIIFVPQQQQQSDDFRTRNNGKSELKGKINLNISSTDIRARLAKQSNCQHLLAEPVLAFINKNKLYR